MKVLVIGSSDNTPELLHALSAPRALTHCRDSQSAADTLSDDSGAYRWIFVDEKEAAASAELLDELRERNPQSVVFLTRSGESKALERSKAEKHVTPICAVETTSDGMQILRCALRCAARDPHGDPRLKEALDDKPLVFQYHAERKAG